jgi:hypothetical protein
MVVLPNGFTTKQSIVFDLYLVVVAGALDVVVAPA